MTDQRAGADDRKGLRLCLWCLLVVVVEVALFSSYQGHDAKFHWFTHFFVGASAALLAMAGVALRTRGAVPLPLVWPLAGHLFAMLPDVLFNAGVAHEPWMDVFLGHISSHFVPGRNLTWYLVFLVCLAAYLAVVFRVGEGRGRATRTRRRLWSPEALLRRRGGCRSRRSRRAACR